MAVLKFSALVSAIQGKLNGSVLSKGKSGAVIYNKPVPRKEPTAKQLQVRGSFSYASKDWDQLSDTQKADWDVIGVNNPVPNRFGDMVEISGYNYFKKMMAFAFPYGDGYTLNPDTRLQDPYQFSVDYGYTEITPTNEGFEVIVGEMGVVTLNDSPRTNWYSIYISLPVSDPNKPYFKTWYLIGTGQNASLQGIGADLYFGGYGVIMPTGFRSFDGAKHLLKAVGFIPNQGRFSVEQITNPVNVWIPMVSYPSVTPYDGASTSVRPKWQAATGRIFGNLAFILGDGTVNYSSIYSVILKVAPIQAGTSTPPDGSFTTENTFTIAFDGANSRHQLQTGSPSSNMYVWLGVAIGAVYPSKVGQYLPIKWKFKNVSTLAESTPEYLFWLIAPE